MYYYEIDFNPTEDLVSAWGISDKDDGFGGCVDVCVQSFYIKTSHKIESKEQMKEYLLANFKPTDRQNEDLVNCIEPETANEVHSFCEIDAEYFESCCGIPA